MIRLKYLTLSACALFVLGVVGCGSDNNSAGGGGSGGAAGRGGSTGEAGSAAGTTGTAGAAGSAVAGSGGGATAGTGGAAGGSAGHGGSAGGTAGAAAGHGGSAGGHAGAGGAGGNAAACRLNDACTPGETCVNVCTRGLRVECACPASGQYLCSTVNCPRMDAGTPDASTDGGMIVCAAGTSTGDPCDPRTDETCDTMCSATNHTNRTCLCAPINNNRGQWACSVLNACTP
jgi:hypothetical protein